MFALYYLELCIIIRILIHHKLIRNHGDFDFKSKSKIEHDTIQKKN